MRIMKTHWKTGLLGIVAAALLSACASPSVQHATQPSNSIQTAARSERLGTGWGDEVDSRVSRVHLRRTSATPIDETAIRYANKTYQGRSINSIALAAGKIELSVRSDRRALPLVRDGNHYYLQGQAGQAYQLVYRNRSNDTYEIVASVDGLDVINGQNASRQNAGYVLHPHASLVIEGFRKSDTAVASFIFSSPADSYAANSAAQAPHNTGIIGTAVYKLYDPQRHTHRRLPRPNPRDEQDGLNTFPADNGRNSRYAQPPR